MTAIILLNIVFAAFVVVGILALLGWGVASDRTLAGRTGARHAVGSSAVSPVARRRAARLSARIA
jgi:hypothetical protein